MKKILALILCLTPTIAHADPISFIGINMSMTLEQQQQILAEAGYMCEELKYPWGTTYIACKDGNKQILPTKKKVTFSCENFNACKFSAKELAQAIVNDNFVSEMKFDPKLVNDGSSSFYIDRYCGRGADGDNLCVVADKSFTGGILLQIIIEKGALGSGGIKFN